MAYSHLEVVSEMFGEVTQLAIGNGFSSPLQQQQLVKGLKDVNAGLMDGAHYGPVYSVAYCAHHDGSCSNIQAYKQARTPRSSWCIAFTFQATKLPRAHTMNRRSLSLTLSHRQQSAVSKTASWITLCVMPQAKQ